MNNEYVRINKTEILKRIEELETEILYHHKKKEYLVCKELSRIKLTLEELLSQSTPLIPDIKDIQIWLSKQSYQKEYGEQEYMMYYDVDIPKIIQDYITNLKLDI